MAIGQDIAPSTTEGGTGIQNLAGFADVKNLVSPDKLTGLKTDLQGMGSKMTDLGAKFKDSDAAKKMLQSVEKPDVPNYDGAFSSLSDMMSQHKPDLDALMGSGSGALGLPNMTDFIAPITGGDEIQALVDNGVSIETIAGINAMLDRAEGLFDTAGIDLDAAPPVPNLGTYMSAATSLHKIGAENNGSGSLDAIKKLIPSGANADKFSDSIRASLSEGKNNSLMMANGIKPPQYNPFEGVPSYAGDDSSLDTNAAGKLLGGG